MRALLPFAVAVVLAFGSSGCHRGKSGDSESADSGGAPSAPGAVRGPSAAPEAPTLRRTVLASDAGGGLGGGELVSLAHYTDGARQLVEAAQILANDRRHTTATTLHLMARYLSLPAIQKSFHDVGGEPERAASMVEQELSRVPTTTVPSALSPELFSVLKRAEREAGEREAGARDVSVGDLIKATVEDPTPGSIGDLDRAGPTAEQVKVKRIVLLGRLDRFLAPRR